MGSSTWAPATQENSTGEEDLQGGASTWGNWMGTGVGEDSRDPMAHPPILIPGPHFTSDSCHTLRRVGGGRRPCPRPVVCI